VTASGDHPADLDAVVRHEEGLGVLDLAVVGDDRDPGVDRLLDRRQDRLRILGVDDEDVDAGRDQGLDVRRLGLRRELGVVAGVRPAAGLDGALQSGLVAKAVALLLERGPRHADMTCAGCLAPPEPLLAAGGADAGAAVLADGVAPPPLQAANATAAIDRNAVAFRMDMVRLLQLGSGSRRCRPPHGRPGRRWADGCHPP
jgi:hypothetical protein